MNEKINVDVIEEIDEFFSVPVAITQPGTVACDFSVFEKQIAKRAKECKLMVLDENNYRFIADTKAGINKSITLLTNYSNNLKKEYLKPFTLYETNVKKCIAKMEEAKLALQQQIEEFDDKVDKEKAEGIKETFKKLCEENGFKYVNIEQIWNPKWTNKTYKQKDILKDINNSIESINKAIDVLCEYDDKELLIAEFFEKLNYSSLQSNSLLNEIIASYNIRRNKVKEMQALKEEKPKPVENTGGYNFVLTIKNASQQQAVKLANFVKENGFDFELKQL